MPRIDVGGGDKEKVLEGSARFGNLLYVFQCHASRITVGTSGRDDALVTLGGFREQGDGSALSRNKM